MIGVIFLILRILSSIALYCFLAVAILTIWRELQKTSTILTTRNTPPIRFKRLDFEGLDQKEFLIPVISIGRDPASDYPISDETVSAYHARLSYHHQQWWVEDLNSTNGTMLNDDPLTVPILKKVPVEEAE